MITVLASLAATLAVFVGVYTLSTPGRLGAIASRLEKYDRSPTPERGALLSRPFASRVGVPVLRTAGRLGSRVLPSSLVSSIERRLVLAGEPVSLHAFLTLQVTTACLSVVLVLFAIARNGGLVFTLASLGAATLLSLLPLCWLRLKVAARKKALLRALPDAVDLIVTTVEAGLSVDSALAEVGRETKGPLGDELRLAIRETTLGSSRRDALQRLNERTGVPELKTLIQAILQAELTGIPIGPVLRVQAEQVRLRRRQHAEAEAQRAPVKMVILLVTLVLPAMLLTIMGPALLRLGDAR